MSAGVETLEAPRAPIERASGAPSQLVLGMVLLFFLLEYVRPPLLSQLKLQLLLLVLLPGLWLTARERPWHPILTAQIAFLALCAAAVPFAWNNYSAYFVTRTVYGNVALAVVMAWVFSWRDHLRRGTLGWMVVMGYLAVYGITHAGTGPGGFLGDENDLALACCCALPLAVFGAQHLRGPMRIGAGLLAVLLVAAIVASRSRGGFVGLAGVVVWIWFDSPHRLRNAAIVLGAAVVFVAFSPADYIDEIRSIRETTEGTAKARRFLWTTATNMWRDHVLLGVGGGNFNWLAGQYQPRDFEGRAYQQRSWTGQATHSFYFQALAEQGLVGIFLLGFISVSHFRLLRQLRRETRGRSDLPPDLRRDTEIFVGGLSGAMVAFLLASAFLSVLYYPYFWYFSAMAVALDVAVRRELPPAQSDASA